MRSGAAYTTGSEESGASGSSSSEILGFMVMSPSISCLVSLPFSLEEDDGSLSCSVTNFSLIMLMPGSPLFAAAKAPTPIITALKQRHNTSAISFLLRKNFFMRFNRPFNCVTSY